MQWVVEKGENGLKLIEFLKLKLPTSSSRQIKKNIETNGCKINGRMERFASTLVGAGDKIVFQLTERQVEEGGVLFEDEHLFIYNKPSGISSDDPNFIRELEKVASTSLYLLHRLDKETTGVLLLAKTKEMNEKMLDLFKNRKIEKTYYAVVDGIPAQDHGVIDNYLGKLHSYQGQAMWGAVEPSKGLRARTLWKTVKKGKKSALVECHPITGRTHQIRVHLSEMGYPILGDYQYGRQFRCSYSPRRCLLHCFELSFIDPIKETAVKVSAPLPNEMETALKTLME